MTFFGGYSLSTADIELPALQPHFHNITPEKADRIAQIDTEIRRAGDDIIKILTRRAGLERTRNSFVPAVNLPAELLVVIFEFACCANDIDEITENTVEKMKRFRHDPRKEDSEERPMPQQSYTDTCAVTRQVIGRVCSVWRSIALESSQLWANITLPVDTEHADAQADILRHSLSKSGSYPLTVKLVSLPIKRGSYNDPYEIPTPVIDVLATQAHRLHTLDFMLPKNWESVLSGITDCMPMLQRITLRCPGDRHDDSTVKFFARAPQLQDVTLIGYGVQEVVLPWAQLDRFETVCYEALDCFEALQRSPHLRHCSLQYSSRLDNGKRLAFVPLTHTKLESLRVNLTYSKGSNFRVFLDAISLPMLRSLTINFYDNYMVPLAPFLTRSACCALETLRLDGILLPTDDLMECLQALPGLRELQLRNPNAKESGVITRRLLDFMNPRKHADSDYLVPNLATFNYEGQIKFTAHALVTFLSDRWHGPPGVRASPVAKLGRVMFKTSTMHFKSKDETILQNLRKEGMHVEIVDFNGRRQLPLP